MGVCVECSCDHNEKSDEEQKENCQCPGPGMREEYRADDRQFDLRLDNSKQSITITILSYKMEIKCASTYTTVLFRDVFI